MKKRRRQASFLKLLKPRSQAVQKAPDARKAEEASEDSTAQVRRVSSRRPANADGALSTA
ncbi:MAG: hypothetical protein K0Q75_1298 [Anaerospora sp.]|jgi:hypothetical protein|nr:hypothetical protein [Anaerospora sp.]